MCNPLAIGIGLMAAGTGAQMHGQRRAEEAAVNVRRAEDARQTVYRGEAEAGFDRNMTATSRETVDAGITDNSKQREAAYNAANMAAPRAAEQASSGSLGGNRVVATNLGDAIAKANAYVQQLGAARAQLNAFGDTMFDQQIETGRGRQDIGQAANLAMHSLKPLEAEGLAASHKGSNTRALGSLLSTVGAAIMGGAGAAAGGAAGAAGHSLGGAAAAAAPTGLAALFGGGATPWLMPALLGGTHALTRPTPNPGIYATPYTY
jgi:hypothetical protein